MSQSLEVEIAACKEHRTALQEVRNTAQDDLNVVLVQIGKLEYLRAVEDADSAFDSSPTRAELLTNSTN